MLLNQFLNLGHLLRLEAIVRRQFYGRFNPELGLAIGVLDVHMGSRFLTRKEVEAETTNPEHRRTHATRIAQLVANLATRPNGKASAAARTLSPGPLPAASRDRVAIGYSRY